MLAPSQQSGHIVRICLASIHPRRMSGQIEGLIALQHNLERLGHQVRVVSAFDPGALADPECAPDGQRMAPRLLRIGKVLGGVIAAGQDCDVLQLNLPTPAFALAGDLVRMATRRPTVIGFEAHLADVASALPRVRAAPEFYLPRVLVNNGWVARAALRQAERYIVSSQYQRAELETLGYDPERVSVIPNLISEEKLGRWPMAAARAELGLPDDPLVGYLGHFHDVKGHDILVEAFRHLRATDPRVRLVVAWSGIGSGRRFIAQLARLHLTEAVIELNQVNVGQFLSAVDVLALPYRFTLGQAAFPGTVLEALSVGVPLVTTRLPLLEEIVEDGRTGLLAQPGDPESLARQLSRLLADQQLAAQLATSARSDYGERFQSEKLAGRYVAAYEDILAREARVLQPA